MEKVQTFLPGRIWNTTEGRTIVEGRTQLKEGPS